MSWLSELAGKAENILNNLDEQTGVALRNHNVAKKRNQYGLHKDPPWVPSPQKKKPQHKSRKFSLTDTKTSLPPTRTPSPYSNYSQSTNLETNDVNSHIKKLPVKKLSKLKYNLENCPRTLVGDAKTVECEEKIRNTYRKPRRNSYPIDTEMTEYKNITCLVQNMQDLEVENVMLKNELYVMSQEISELLKKLQRVEDGNDVVRADFSKTTLKLENCERLNHTVNLDKASLASQLDQLKQKINYITSCEIQRYKKNYDNMESELSDIKLANNNLEDRLHILEEKLEEAETINKKKETEYRHAQARVEEIQGALEKSQNECKQLEKDWETYKLRVKSMLQLKTQEISELKQSSPRTEGDDLLVQEVEKIKEEREELSASMAQLRGEYEALKLTMSQLETRHESAERVVEALRDALKGEWEGRNRAEAQCAAVTKELKTVQTETGQTIASLRLALRDKESDLNRLRETTSLSAQTSETSALNVADYDFHESLDNEKIHYLTQLLVQKQEKIDGLLAEKNTMRIHFDKLESKYKSELTSLRGKASHSVVQLSDNDGRPRRHHTTSTFTAASNRIAVYIKRNPLFRLFIIVYMISLHFWVMTVLLSKGPDNFVPQYRT